MSIILEFNNRSTLSNESDAIISISEVTVFSNSFEKLVKAKNDGIVKEIVTRHILEIIINERSFNLNSVHSQTLVL